MQQQMPAAQSQHTEVDLQQQQQQHGIFVQQLDSASPTAVATIANQGLPTAQLLLQ
jgi:hypothetical protein